MTRRRIKIALAISIPVAVLVYAVAVWWPRIRMPGRSFSGSLSALTPEDTALRDELRIDVDMLAGIIGERNVPRFEGLREAAAYIHDSLIGAGFEVRADSYRVDGRECQNLEVELPGNAHPAEIVIVGAHYDSVAGSPGANDNATGVAALLALARRFKDRPSARTLRFVAFVNEEPPYSYTDVMGSVRYAKKCRLRGENVVAMFSLETLGYYSDAPNSQIYPFPMGMFYPSTANFIAFVGNVESASLVRESVRVFRQENRFPSEGGAVPDSIPGVGWSDHWSFWQQGYPGVMVTDTALYRYPHYHTSTDTPDKVEYDRFALVVAGLERVIAHFAG